MYAVGVKLLIHQSELRTYTKEVLSLCCVLKNIKCNDITNVRSKYMDYLEPFGCRVCCCALSFVQRICFPVHVHICPLLSFDVTSSTLDVASERDGLPVGVI
jgi:hypothetical protein